MVRPLWLCCGFWLALLLTPAVDAAPSGGIQRVHVGLADGFKLGHWTPVWLTIKAGATTLSGQLQVTAPDGDDLPAVFASGQLAQLRIPAGESQTVIAYIRIGRRDSQMRVRFVSDEAGGESFSRTVRAAELPPAALASQQRVVVVGAPIDMEQAIRFLPRSAGEEIIASHVDDPAALPDRWYGYDGVDALVLTAGRSEFYDELSQPQQQAIAQWVQQGGRAIVAVGRQGERALRDDGFLAQLAPGKFQRVTTLRETASLETMVDAATRLDAPRGGQPPPPLVATQLAEIHGEILNSAGGRALLIRAPHGFGEVLFVGFDLDQDPIAGWPDRGRLISKLLEELWRNAPPSEDQQRGGEAAHLGFDDLAGQLTAALDQFPGVRLVPFSWIAGLIVLYIVLIGPADYFLLRRIGRMELTWLTFSVVALALGATAWMLAGWARGTTVRVNQVEIVDVDAASSRVRGTTWLRIYSPQNQNFALQLEPAASSVPLAQRGSLFAWQGAPGRSLSGMDAPSAASLDGRQYVVRDAATGDAPPQLEIDDLPLAVGATKGFAARWWGEAKLEHEPPLTTSTLKLVRGSIVNPLPVRLTGCVLYHDRWAYRIGTLEPGQKISLDDTASPLDVKWLLTQRTVVDSRDVTTPWDRSMRDDVPRILEMLMFHETAGGRGYTGLLHRYDQFIDLSGQLTAGRAVLVGKAEESATRLVVNNTAAGGAQDQHWTYYRIVLPTTPENQ